MLKGRIARQLAVMLGILVLLASAAVWRVRSSTMPPIAEPARIDFASMGVEFEELRFRSPDGIELSGWWIAGEQSETPVILCHDRRERKDRLIHLALDLHRNGFPVLLFDFRGHGNSQAAASTYGIHEKRDVLAAVDLLQERLPDARRIGVYGVGMGAQAAVLAAVDRPVLKVLVLDRLEPEPHAALQRDFFSGWEFAGDSLAFLPVEIFDWIHNVGDDDRADLLIERLVGRSVLLLAPADEPRLTEDLKLLVARIPDAVDSDGNLVILPATLGSLLYGEQLDRYNTRVSDFFRARLGG